MHKNSIALQVSQAEIEALLEAVDKVPEGSVVTLTEGDELWREPLEVWVRPASHLRDPDDIAEKFEHWFGDYFDFTGRRIPLEERDDAWFAEREAITPFTHAFLVDNSVHRFGDDCLFISRGSFFFQGETTLDGERAFEFHSPDVMSARREAELQPILEAAQKVAPKWALPVTLDDIERAADEEGRDVYYYGPDFAEHIEGDAIVRLSMIARFDADGNLVEQGPVEPSIHIEARARAFTMEETFGLMKALTALVNQLSEVTHATLAAAERAE